MPSKKHLAMAMMLGAMAFNQQHDTLTVGKSRKDYEDEVEADKRKLKPIPKGAFEYRFFEPDFTCIARTQESANAKWERFKLKNLGK